MRERSLLQLDWALTVEAICCSEGNCYLEEYVQSIAACIRLTCFLNSIDCIPPCSGVSCLFA